MCRLHVDKHMLVFDYPWIIIMAFWSVMVVLRPSKGYFYHDTGDATEVVHLHGLLHVCCSISS